MIVLLIISAILFITIPALVIRLCRKTAVFKRIGTIITLYAVGIILANLLIFPFPEFSAKIRPLQDGFTSVTVLLGLSMILFSCDFKKLPIKSSLISLVFGVIAMIIAVVAGFYIFKPLSGMENFEKIAGLLVGIYTGGTPNLAAIKMMLGVEEEIYMLINSFDIIVSFSYLVFVMAIGIKLSRKFLPPFKVMENDKSKAKLKDISSENDSQEYNDIFTKENFKPTLVATLASIVVTGLSVGISILITNGINMIVVILSLTTLSLAFSFIPIIRNAKKSYDAGMYFILIFSIAIASMVDISKINFVDGIWLFAYILFTICVSLIVQVLLSKIFKVDADTTIITSVALVNSPLMVAMIADSMKNKNVILIGVTVGIIGYAVGNYLGFALAAIL